MYQGNQRGMGRGRGTGSDLNRSGDLGRGSDQGRGFTRGRGSDRGGRGNLRGSDFKGRGTRGGGRGGPIERDGDNLNNSLKRPFSEVRGKSGYVSKGRGRGRGRFNDQVNEGFPGNQNSNMNSSGLPLNSSRNELNAYHQYSNNQNQYSNDQVHVNQYSNEPIYSNQNANERILPIQHQNEPFPQNQYQNEQVHTFQFSNDKKHTDQHPSEQIQSNPFQNEQITSNQSQITFQHETTTHASTPTTNTAPDVLVQGNIYGRELDSLIQSEAVDATMQGILGYKDLFYKYPDPLLINSRVMKLSDLFKNKNDYYRFFIEEVFRSCKFQFDKVTNLQEITQDFLDVSKSNDIVPRTIALRTLSTLSRFASDKMDVHYLIFKTLNSSRFEELSEALNFANLIIPNSHAFSEILLPSLLSKLAPPYPPNNVMLETLNTLKHMSTYLDLSNIVKESCLNLFNTLDENVLIEVRILALKVATDMVINSPTHLQVHLEFILSLIQCKLANFNSIADMIIVKCSISNLLVLTDEGANLSLVQFSKIVGILSQEKNIIPPSLVIKLLIALKRSLKMQFLDFSNFDKTQLFADFDNIEPMQVLDKIFKGQETLNQLVKDHLQNLSNLDISSKTDSFKIVVGLVKIIVKSQLTPDTHNSKDPYVSVLSTQILRPIIISFTCNQTFVLLVFLALNLIIQIKNILQTPAPISTKMPDILKLELDTLYYLMNSIDNHISDLVSQTQEHLVKKSLIKVILDMCDIREDLGEAGIVRKRKEMIVLWAYHFFATHDNQESFDEQPYEDEENSEPLLS